MNGEGLPNIFPPLAKSEYLSDKDKIITIVLNGLNGPIKVNGKDFNSVMPPMSQFNEDEIANILTYIRNEWGNTGEMITPDDVAKIRKSTQRPAGAAK